MLHVIKTCPHCKQQFDYHTGTNGNVGCPYIKCPHCGKIIIDSETKEWENLTLKQREAYLGTQNFTETSGKQKLYIAGFAIFDVLFIIILIIILSNLGSGDNSGAIVGIIVMLLFITLFTVAIYKTYKSLQEGQAKIARKITDRDVIDSIKRTHIKEYRDLLTKTGFIFYPIDYSRYDVNFDVQQESNVNNTITTNLRLDQLLNTFEKNDSNKEKLKNDPKNLMCMVYDDQKVYYKKVNITDSETFKKLNLDADKDKVKYANSGINYWLILCDDHAILYRRDADDNPVDCQWTDMMILVSLFKNKNTGK